MPDIRSAIREAAAPCRSICLLEILGKLTSRMGDECSTRPPNIEKLFEGDPYLRHHESDLLLRWNKMIKMESAITSSEGGLAEFARGYRRYGIVQQENGDVEVPIKDQLTYPAPQKFKASSSPSPLFLAPKVTRVSPLRSQE